ncbi:MAG: FCD domain-containing protein [Synergistales bacterium]|nr:FCD domain-containing protein [Synergistales bacterium]
MESHPYLKPLKKKSVADEVLLRMIEAIKADTWRGGEAIPGETALAEMFQVSRASVREALRVLSFFRIIESRPGRGRVLAENYPTLLANTELMRALNNAPPLDELFELRLVLETEVAGWAAQRAAGEDIARLEAILRQPAEKEPPTAPSDILGSPFHRALAEISGNQLLIKVIDSIHLELAYQRIQFARLTETDLALFDTQHRELLRLVKGGRAEEARALMRRHIIYAWDRLSSKGETVREP